MGYELGSKVLAGVVLGFTLAVAVSGLYGWLGPNSLMDKYMVVLWFIVPVWTAVIALSCVFRRAWQVWVSCCWLMVWRLRCFGLCEYGSNNP